MGPVRKPRLTAERKPRIPLNYKNKLIKEIVSLGNRAGFGMAGVPLWHHSLDTLHKIKEEFEQELKTMSESRKELIKRTVLNNESE